MQDPVVGRNEIAGLCRNCADDQCLHCASIAVYNLPVVEEAAT